MASKKKQADEAYERAEDQRALVAVLAAAETGFVPAHLEAAIARVRAHLLTVTEPATPEPSVPGQLNLLDGSIESCPVCGHYDPWTVLTTGDPKVQCGFCAFIALVSWPQYDGIVALRRRAHQHTDTFKSPVIPPKKGKARGAG